MDTIQVHSLQPNFQYTVLEILTSNCSEQMNTAIRSLICEAPQGQDYLCSIIYPHDHAICLTKEADVKDLY